MKTNWIDFKALRAKLDFEQVLEHYRVEVKSKGRQHHGFCPLPNHNGKRNSPSFSANLTRGIFQCFGCGAKGNVLEFAALMENIDPKDGAALHDLAVRLQQRFCPELGSSPSEAKAPTPSQKKPPEKPAPTIQTPAIVNAPLDFELQGLDAAHPYLLGRGFTPQTIERFGLGYCSRGLLKSRVAIPLHNAAGALVGYHAKLVGDILPTVLNPVLNPRNARGEARFGGVKALFQSLEASGDGDGDVVAVLVDDALDVFEVALGQTCVGGHGCGVSD